jgi:hypothetical protein
MGSIAMDGNDNIAIGYSVVDATSTYPGIRYAGRLENDPSNELTQGEAELIAGTGSFQGFRWGDYSLMDIDPADDCTFWFTQMYIGVAGLSNWQTRVGSFKFPSCSAPGYGTLQGTATDANGPLAGVHVGVTNGGGGGGSNTSASGQYAFDVPAGTYSLTASKYGYTPVVAPNVSVTAGGQTTQDFVLVAAPAATVSGTVRDGSGGNWPVYAKLVISTPGGPTLTTFSDPVTGAYSISLISGNTFRFKVTAVAGGYASGGGLVPLSPAGATVDWTLTVDPVACNAPGYLRQGLSEGFDAGVVPPGWLVVTPSGPPWTVLSADPCGQFENQTGGEGPFAVANSDCAGEVLEDAELRTPAVDMSGFSSASVGFRSSFFSPGGGLAEVDVSTDGGSSWTNVLQLPDGGESGPARHDVDITAIAAGHADVRARFHLSQAFDSGWWQVDDAFLGDPTCVAGAGGLVVGNVLDANTGAGLNGAAVVNEPPPGGDATVSFPTPEDSAQPDGLYVLFAPAGSQSVGASLERYTPQSLQSTVAAHDAVRLDFHLAAGRLDASPRPLAARVDPGGSIQLPLDLVNSGGSDATFTLIELAVAPPPPPGAAAADPAKSRAALARVPAGARDRRDTRGIAAISGLPRAAAPLAAGNVVNAHPTGLPGGWGIAYDTDADRFWLSDAGIFGGDDMDHGYLSDGSPTGETIDDSPWVEEFAADGAFNSRTGKLWHVNVGGDNCLWELDPFTRLSTGNSICGSPWSDVSQRGVAYDVLSDTYYVGGWNEGVVYRIDGTGAVLGSWFVALPIAGLAFDSTTGHLFVLTNHSGPPQATLDVFVLDASRGMSVVGAFNVTQNGVPVPGLSLFGGAGMELDCRGRLWVVDQADQTVFEVESGEPRPCAFNDVPWLSESPTSGVVPASSTLPVACTLDGAGLTAGLRQAQLKLTTSTPYPVPPVPVSLTVRFLDVADGSLFDPSIYAAAGAGVMPGCDPAAFLFCPTAQVTRADMAGFILRAVHGPAFVPAPYSGAFNDVQAGDYNADYIQSFFDEGYTVGCGGGNFCPDAIHTRAQTAVFILKGRHGTSYAPPPCAATHQFDDVPCPPTPEAPFGDWIGELFVEGITAGCGGNSFCPATGIPNQQMAAFLVRAFGLPHL